MSQTRLNHVALLVPSVKKAAAYLASLGLEIGPEEVWDGEGTREIYVASAWICSLLLMEPTREGAYSRALKKRGPGLHHVAIDVLDLGPFAASLAGTGWLLHPKSVATAKETQTLWLARPGVPLLVEVQQRPKLPDGPAALTRIEGTFSDQALSMLAALDIGELFRSTGTELGFTLHTRNFTLAQLL